jgi:hypothetical protein
MCLDLELADGPTSWLTLVFISERYLNEKSTYFST